MLLMEPLARTPSRPASRRPRRTRIVKPSRVRGVIPEFLDEVPFGILGHLEVGAVKQPRPEHSGDIVRWISLRPGTERDQINLCAAENPTWFKAWSTLRLVEPSLRLPRDTVAVYVVSEPTSVAGDPPPSVIERWNTAMKLCPQAATFYIEPFFDVPSSAQAKPLTAVELRQAVDEQWTALAAKAHRWGWIFRLERSVIEWSERRERRRELRQRAQMYLEMLQQAERARTVPLPQPERETQSRRVALDERLAARRRQRQAEDNAWVERQLSSMPSEVRGQVAQIERDVRELEGVVRARGRMTQSEAQVKLSRREFNVAMVLGLVSFPQTFQRRDPILALRQPDEKFVRLVAHWDRWNVEIDGREVMTTFVHV